MLSELRLGQKTFPINLIQGPLAGVSAAPFRVLTQKFMHPAFACTEMISCKTLLQQSSDARKRFVTKLPGEAPLCFQLASSDPFELGKAVRLVTDLGADLIDLNCGCPVKKIRRKGAGSRLLTESSKLYQLITAMKQNTHLPVSIKIRVEKGEEKFNAEVAQVVTDAGADFLVVHGRHWTEHYETPCRYEDIQFFVQQLKIPVIGNGDIRCLESLKNMFATGCHGVMIARAGVGQPWLIQKLVAEMQGSIFIEPMLPEVGRLFLDHVEGLTALLESEKFAILQARKLAKYYGRRLEKRTEFCQATNDVETVAELRATINEYFV